MDQESIRLKQEAKKIEAGFGYRFGRQLKGEFAALSKDMKDFEEKVASKVGSTKLVSMAINFDPPLANKIDPPLLV